MSSLVKATALPLFILALVCLLRFYPWRERANPTAEQLLAALATADASNEQVVTGDDVAWTGYARVYARRVVYADGRNVTFDVWGRTWRGGTFGVAVAVPFDRNTRTFTLVREFCIAHGRHVYSFPAGQIERKHHGRPADAAVAELAEEARLTCASPMQSLLSTDAVAGAPQDKFQREAVHYFLCDRTKRTIHNAARDPEERIVIVPGVRPDALRTLVRTGAMQSNMIAAAMLALDNLRSRRLI